MPEEGSIRRLWGRLFSKGASFSSGSATSLNIPPGDVAQNGGLGSSNTGQNRIKSVSGPNTWFSPWNPLPPLAPPGVGGRAFDYPTGENLNYVPRGAGRIMFHTLRALADNHPLTRIVLEKRKDQIAGWDWDIQPVLTAKDRRKSKASDEPDPRIVEAKAFLRQPDRRMHFHTWLRVLLEDMLVIDAACIYPRKNRGGKLISLDVIDGSCYSDDTEVLTRRGWLLFQETNESDEFATRNPKTKAFEWQRATYRHEADFVGQMVALRSRAVDILVSPNHRVLISNPPRELGIYNAHLPAREHIVTAESLASCSRLNATIPMTSRWDGVEVETRSFRTADPRSKTISMSGDDYCAFMGMWLAEGSRYRWGACVSQMPDGRGFEAYRELIERIFGRSVCHTGTNFVLSSAGLRDHLEQFGHALTKFVPDEIMGATPRQLAIFWRYYHLGDGSAERDRIHTSSRRMADQLVEIAQKMGKSASVQIKRQRIAKMANGLEITSDAPGYVVSVRTTEAMLFSVSREMYHGKIRCVSVPNEILYVRRNGKPAWCGNTIKQLIDYSGRPPLPEDGPAYQQILHGVPADDFTLDELIYAPRNLRSNHLYGFSPVEQIILTINTSLRRDVFNLEYYNSGTIPDSFGTLPADWTQDQIQGFQTYFDSLMSGNLAEKRKLRFMPDGFKFTEVRSPPLKDQYDEWLARLVCAAFSIPPNPFVADNARATAQTIQVTTSQEGIGPLKSWVKATMDHVIQSPDLMNLHDLEFVWSGEDMIDPLEKAQETQILVAAGIKTRDEARVEYGLAATGAPLSEGATTDHPVFALDGPAGLPPVTQESQDAAIAAAKAKPAPTASGGKRTRPKKPVHANRAASPKTPKAPAHKDQDKTVRRSNRKLAKVSGDIDDRTDEVSPDIEEYWARTAGLVALAQIDRTFTIPYLANRSGDGETVYIDESVPHRVAGVETSLTLPWHEMSEWLAMNAGLEYDLAHRTVANPIERRRVESLGGTWDEYCAAFDPLIREVGDEEITRVPGDLDLRPYEEDDDKVALRELAHAED